MNNIRMIKRIKQINNIKKMKRLKRLKRIQRYGNYIKVLNKKNPTNMEEPRKLFRNKYHIKKKILGIKGRKLYNEYLLS